MRKFLFILLVCCTMQFAFASEMKPQKFIVILDWFPNPDHAPLIIAQQKGFFKEQGLDVELIGPTDPTDPAKWVAAKKADIGITYEPELMQQIDRGLPLIRVGTLIDKPLNCLVTLNGNDIKSLADLKGKQIGTSTSGLASIMLKTMLAKQGLTEKDITLVNVRYNLTQALLSHKVSAVTGMLRNFEVPQLEAQGQKVNAYFPEEYGIPNYSELVFIAHTTNAHDKRISRFMDAIKKAVAYLDTHPKETWQLFAETYPESNNAVNREAWFATMPYFAEDPAMFDESEWNNFARFMHQNKLIKTVQPISRYAIIV